ncbi:MAG: hypothetical protein ACI845_002891 [Gammaproteobacteria bacterium]|jgi:hypothetical protein
MAEPHIQTPVNGSRIVSNSSESILFGQPPEILKSLIRQKLADFDTLVLIDSREKDGSLLNNIEFLLYYFLFFSNGLAENRKINLVGDEAAISQVLRLLRYTLFGPTQSEFEIWGTDPDLSKEWLNVSRYLALKDVTKKIIPVEGFFNSIPFQNDVAVAGDFVIEHRGTDRYLISCSGGDVDVDMREFESIQPPYAVPMDYVPGGLSKLGVEVLGGASGFSTDEPCTGLALCYNGDYLLIDSIPFLDQHLFARGISKNQITALFLTHLHDDHCSMFPLMHMTHRVEVITTTEIFRMAMEKLSCSLGWQKAVVEESFVHIPVKPGDIINYFGLNIKVHHTVHSIPTIGATFSTIHRGQFRDVCIVGDNQNMTAVRDMTDQGIVQPSTLANIENLYQHNFHLLIADGGAGAIHGDPNDARESKAERVVFVHVDEVPEKLKTTFSLASSGKRYTLLDGDSNIYTSLINHYLTLWLGQPFPNRWMRNLLAEEEIYRYNAEDVMLVQGSDTHGSVFLLLTGYCDVVRYENGDRHTVATLQAGDVIGEMAVLTGSGVRNASVVARTPVTVCVFGEETFRHFIQQSGIQESLEKRWLLRPIVKIVPQFNNLSTRVCDQISRLANWMVVKSGGKQALDQDHLYIFVEGEAVVLDSDGVGQTVKIGKELGWRPYSPNQPAEILAQGDCGLLMLDSTGYLELLQTCPELNFNTRKRLMSDPQESPNWLLGIVNIN